MKRMYLIFSQLQSSHATVASAFVVAQFWNFIAVKQQITI
jgi:hypothetical protein